MKSSRYIKNRKYHFKKTVRACLVHATVLTISYSIGGRLRDEIISRIIKMLFHEFKRECE